MPDEMTPARARRTVDELADEYEPNLLYGVATGQQQANRIPDVDDRNRFVAAAEQLDDEEIRRRVYNGDEPPRGPEETPEGTASMEAAARQRFGGPNYPVTMDVEVIGQPGEREIEIVPQDFDGPGVDELEPVLEKTFPSDRAADDPVHEFISAVGAAVADAFPRDLDDVGFAGRVGSVRVRSDGSWTFAPGDDPAAAFEESQQMTPRERAEFEGRGTTRPTTQRSERTQQTLAEAGSSESLVDFADGTVEDDPGDVVSPSADDRRRQAMAQSQTDRTAPASQGLGRFEQFDAVIKFAVGRDGTDHGTFLIPPDGRVVDVELKQSVETAVAEAADVDTMRKTHGSGTTVTIGTARFGDGGDEFDGFDLNDNWHGSQPRV